MIKKIIYRRNPHQEEFHTDDKTRNLHLSGGFGAGKTHALVQKSFDLSIKNRHFDGGLVVPSFPEFKRDFLPVLEDIAHLNHIDFQYHGQDHYIRYPWSKGKIWVQSAENKIRGPNWAFALLNEVTLMKEVTYKEAVGRVRVKGAPNPQIASVGTPEGDDHWAYDRFIGAPKANHKIIYGDTRDNAVNLDPMYIQSLYDSYDSIMIDAYLRGLFINMKGNRFYYAYNQKNEDKEIEFIKDFPILIGMDFNVNPMTASLWHKVIIDGKTRLIGFDEIYIMGADTKKMCQAIKARNYNPEHCVIYPDPAGKNNRTSGKSDIQILNDEGFHNVTYKTTAPRFRERQLNMNNLLEKEIILLNPLKMPRTKKDLQSVQQNPIDLGKEKKNPELTHLSDGLDYLCDNEFPFKHKRTATVSTFINN